VWLKRIGLLGCGAIGTQIALAIDSGKIPAKLTHVYDLSKERAYSLVSKLKTKPEITQNAALLASSPVDLIIEAASQNAVRDNALTILQNRKDLMIMSVGALLDESIFDVILEGCKDFKKQVYLPSGAIAGLDAIKSVKSELESLTLVTTKNPKSLKSANFFAFQISRRRGPTSRGCPVRDSQSSRRMRPLPPAQRSGLRPPYVLRE